MVFGFRSRLATGALVASLLLPAVALGTAGKAFADEFDRQMNVNKRKKSEAKTQSALVGKVTTETEIVVAQNISPMLTQDSASQMHALANRYAEIAANGGFPKVPRGTYKKGGQNKNVMLLNKRLFIEGYLRQEATEGEFATRMTSATADAVMRFQRNMGLASTGVVDGPTLAALNVPAGERLRTIQANIARLQTYSENLGDRYLVVNVPAQQIETVSDGKVFSRHNAIVGRPERPTPVVMTALSDVNFNPYWNAPASIVEKDIIPKMTSGTRILEEMNIKVFQGFGGPEINPKTVNWRRAIADDYHFRQEPGPGNAMATAKINFPSPFGIYLHDTPEQHLFKSGQRFFSSGCVRVEKMDLLLEWVLNGQEGIGSSQIAALAETLERRDVKLETPPQLRVTYLTAWPVGNTVAFRGDIYGLDGTGFTLGQPMPEGELSDEGQRFVLKPVPRKPGAVDADEAEGFGLFGSRRSVGKNKGKSSPSIFASNADTFDMDNASFRRPATAAPGKGKKPVATAVKKSSGKLDAKKRIASNKDAPGLFDWAAYRKQQKATVKKLGVVADKKTKKKVAAKKVDVAAADPKFKAVAAPKKAVAGSPVVEKKLEDKTTKKVAAADPKVIKKALPEATAKSADAAVKKKPAEAAKKVAEACKPDAGGKLPKGCKAPAAKKP